MGHVVLEAGGLHSLPPSRCWTTLWGMGTSRELKTHSIPQGAVLTGAPLGVGSGPLHVLPEHRHHITAEAVWKITGAVRHEVLFEAKPDAEYRETVESLLCDSPGLEDASP